MTEAIKEGVYVTPTRTDAVQQLATAQTEHDAAIEETQNAAHRLSRAAENLFYAQAYLGHFKESN